MIGALLEIVGLALQLWVSKEKRKYIDALSVIEAKFREEMDKPYLGRNHALLDSLEFELRQLSRNIAADIRSTNALVSPG